jgi:5-methylcytosine-specific restriction enzyme subunit McrC
METKSISEYGYIYCSKFKPIKLSSKFIHTEVTEEQFDELYSFWKSSKEAKRIFDYDGYTLKAQNYVGVVQTQNITIEILPKIYNTKNLDEVREIFIEMLKPLLNINEIQINRANLGTTKNRNIYEVFISMFIDYLNKLIHKGIKSEYIEKEENQKFLKGKLQFTKQIRKNYIHKEKFYVKFDEYLPNRAENRLIKSTISLLLKKTRNYKNKKDLRQQLFIFDEIDFSLNYKSDINKTNLHRGMEHYEIPIKFAKLFLTHHSFTSLRGKENVFALLFPMQTVFEKYMEFVLENSKERLGIKRVLVNGGENEYFLSNENCKMARLEPDYLLEMKDGTHIVSDAKWKISEEKENCKLPISSNDIHQIFAYLNFYNSQNSAYIFVPKTEDREDIIELDYMSISGEIDKQIKTVFIDLSELIKTHIIKNYIKRRSK